MKRQLALLAGGLMLALLAAGFGWTAIGTSYSFPNDSGPYWSWDARLIGFDREAARTGARDAYVVPAGHGIAHWLAPTHARGWRPGGGGLLVEFGRRTGIFAPDGTPLGGADGVAATWSPDGERIAYRRNGLLYVADGTGAGEHRVAAWTAPPSWDLTGPVWSPDGKEIAFADGSSLLVAATDGSGVRTLFTGMNQSVNPNWSPNGATIAFERNVDAQWAIWLVDAGGANLRQLTDSTSNSRFPQWAPSGDRLAFISDREGIRGEASPYRYGLYVEVLGGRATKLLDDVRPDSPARWSPTGAQIAAAAGQECLRWGIYVVRPDLLRSRRVTNDCHVDGTSRSDVLRGRPYYDVIRGFGGDDTIYARDRVRDSIDCGPGRDTAYVDRIDAVKNCERVRRA
jgi:TolB protein